MIGKGKRGAEVKEAMQKHQAAYLVAIGGAGARIAKCIKKAEVLAYPELGPEAIRRLEVENMPLICANDAAGGDLYQMGAETYKR
jgi:fumarate hydratase subunit beta